MKKQRKIITVLTLLLTLILSVNLLAGCEFGEIYDDDEKIAKSQNYVISGFVSENVNNTFSARAKKFSGTYGVGFLEVTKGWVAIGYSCTVTSGRFKLVAVKDGEVYVIFEGEGSAEMQNYNLPNGKYQMKMVGDQAVFEMSFAVVGA